MDRIEAIPVNCNKRCGLVEVAGHSKLRPKTCSLCGSSFAKTWDQLCCGGTPVAQGQASRGEGGGGGATTQVCHQHHDALVLLLLWR